MPTTFTTPMFWSTQELEELAGTTVQGMGHGSDYE